MANCPKCGVHLRLVDWKQRCPHCGANVFLYDLQERLMLDADKAEVQHYHFQKKVDRVKASFVGSKPAIARIVTSVLPLGAVFLPLFRADLSAFAPDLPQKFDALKIYDLAQKADLGALLGYLTSSGRGGILFLAAAACLALGLVSLLLHLILLFLSCSPKGKARNVTLSAAMIVFSAASAVLFTLASENGFPGAAPGLGLFVFLLLAAVNMAVEVLVFKQGIEIVHKQCYVGGIPIEEYFGMLERKVPHEEIRAEMYRRMTAQQQEKERELEEKERAHEHHHGKEASAQ